MFTPIAKLNFDAMRGGLGEINDAKASLIFFIS
jgi:hypothetical protein